MRDSWLHRALFVRLQRGAFSHLAGAGRTGGERRAAHHEAVNCLRFHVQDHLFRLVHLDRSIPGLCRIVNRRAAGAVGRFDRGPVILLSGRCTFCSLELSLIHLQ